MPARVDQITITNWQENPQDVRIPQYQFDLYVLWTDSQGVQHEHSNTYRYPNDIADMPIGVRREFAEQMIMAMVRVTLGIDAWDQYTVYDTS